MIILNHSEASTAPLEVVEKVTSKEDIATMMQTWEAALKEDPRAWERFGGFGEMQGRYFFLEGNFDGSLWDWLNSKGAEGVLGAKVGALNAKALCGKGRGIPTKRPWESAGWGSRGGADADSEEATGYLESSEPTGYLDERSVGVRAPKLRRMKGGAVMDITERESIIGRSLSKCRMVVSGNKMVSRTHAKVWLQNGRVFLEDLGSSNGTYVNGVKLMPGEARELQKGELILLSDEEFILE